MNFCQHPMRLVDLPSTSVKFPCSQKISFYFLCGQEIFRQLSVLPGDIPLNFSTFSSTRRPFINLRQHSTWLEDLPLTFVNFLCRQKTFHQLSVRLGDFPSISSNFPSGRPSVNFRHLSVQPGELLSIPPNFCATGRTSINFLCCRESFRQPSSTFRMVEIPSINSVKFPCG